MLPPRWKKIDFDCGGCRERSRCWRSENQRCLFFIWEGGGGTGRAAAEVFCIEQRQRMKFTAFTEPRAVLAVTLPNT